MSGCTCVSRSPTVGCSSKSQCSTMPASSTPRRNVSATGARRGSAQRRYEAGGLALKVFLVALDRRQQPLQIAIGLLPPPFHRLYEKSGAREAPRGRPYSE